MCGRMRIGGREIRPGDSICIDGETLTWGGSHVPFARFESIEDKWLKNGWELYGIPVEGFAERNRTSGELVWDNTACQIIVAVKGGEFAVVTRQATPEEQKFFGHHRVPVTVKG
jgi:hypothetical protein